jgi:tetrahydromethanopterin S-methyltransferase subunit B
MRLLFKEAIQTCFNPPEDRFNKLNAWVENSNLARDPTNPNLEAYPNQYDKAEELITFYIFAPLVLSLDRVSLVNRILSLAKVRVL